MIGGQGVSIGVGLVTAVDVDTGVGDGGGPGQIEMSCKKGPAADGVPQGAMGMPLAVVGQGIGPLPPPPQLHEKATAISIIAAPISIHRALSIIGIQL
ncbi:MAG TPA: hypothetical protein VGY99_07010 [Candidatus Binataceae bacterium]|jgi:hypothetical protein|nr:hypothetical protein [Candidatus Binataceae bacterium]